MSYKVLQGLLALPFSWRQRRLTRTREAFSATEFVEQIAERGGDIGAANALWKHLEGWICAEGFTPYPTDSLGSIFGIGEEELDEDLILGILRELDLPPPSQEIVNRFGAIDTPLDVAIFAALCRRLGSR